MWFQQFLFYLGEKTRVSRRSSVLYRFISARADKTGMHCLPYIKRVLLFYAFVFFIPVFTEGARLPQKEKMPLVAESSKEGGQSVVPEKELQQNSPSEKAPLASPGEGAKKEALAVKDIKASGKTPHVREKACFGPENAAASICDN